MEIRTMIFTMFKLFLAKWGPGSEEILCHVLSKYLMVKISVVLNGWFFYLFHNLIGRSVPKPQFYAKYSMLEYNHNMVLLFNNFEKSYRLRFRMMSYKFLRKRRLSRSRVWTGEQWVQWETRPLHVQGNPLHLRKFPLHFQTCLKVGFKTSPAVFLSKIFNGNFSKKVLVF